MRVIIRWSSSAATKSNRSPRLNRKTLAAREARIRDLMRLAVGTPAGLAYADSADLLDAIEKVARVESVLTRFPVVPRDQYFFQRERYLNPDSGESGFQRFDYPIVYPLATAPRTAILMEGFVETAKVMCFPDGWGMDLDRFRPECLAGPVAALRRMATCVFNRGARFPSLRRLPVVAFTGLPFGETGILTDADRDQFWKAFNLPVTEYFLGDRHEILARECEAHTGLHIDPMQAVFEVVDPETSELVITSLANSVFPVVRLASGLAGEVTEAPCACGAAGQRVINIRPLAQKFVLPRIRVRAAAVGLEDRAEEALPPPLASIEDEWIT